ncbi:MAG: UDP-N-acetylglucosamine 1-carboxyvinyltransferase, partial [bacterium]|nr:UDP-N-acetylglucosamine 1-carboxyvinyltransferase [bacterium]
VERLAPGHFRICAKNADITKINSDLIAKMRSSILILGPATARFGYLKFPHPGGCQIGSRIIDPHLLALTELGAQVEACKGVYELSCKKLKGVELVMDEFSVTATENALMAAVLAEGRTTIKCAASDFYVQDLACFLRKMGAKISGIGAHRLIVDGVEKLRGVNYSIMPDPIEMGTFVSLLAATKSRGIVKNFVPEFLEIELLKFKEANVNLGIQDLRRANGGWDYKIGELVINSATNLKAVKKVHNMPHPGFTADLIQPFAVLMTQAEGTSLVHDWMYEGRLKYIDELIKMGANAVICDPHRALITGPTPLYGTNISSFDLRTGATLIIAALVAQGETVINNTYQVDRGYEKIEQRLQQLGADIKRI